MIISATFSKPTAEVEKKLGKAYEKIKIKAENSSEGNAYFVEFFTEKQVFHKHFSEAETLSFIKENAGITFKNCIEKTDSEEIQILANKKGKITELRKSLKSLNKTEPAFKNIKPISSQKKKNYILEEGKTIPFLVLLGIMTPEGKVISSKYDKFRQINRFLEFIDDVIPEIMALKTDKAEPLRVADFGCGKSYLTFAVHYYLTEIRHLPCEIEGLDLKEDVIKYCNDIAQKLNLKNLAFNIGNISDYSGKSDPDLIITLHACDTATDFALKYAVERKAKAILSVPCCQHQINQQLQKNNVTNSENVEPLLKWGIIKEKFSSLLTDAIRGQWLENQGYNVQMLEFIDIEHTPKNILIRAVKKQKDLNGESKEFKNLDSICSNLNICPEILK